MKQLIFKQFLSINIEQAWDFFSSPHNLNKITPDGIHFKILNNLPEKMYPGMLITYQIKPFLDIPFDWVTEISHVQERRYFIDEQRLGPYRLWHHEHHFEQVDGGILMTDKLYYDIGKSIFGWLAGKLFVHKKVEAIFNYRYQKLEELFAKKIG
jgi:ligand-binding SRPBCC domain-containing protein